MFTLDVNECLVMSTCTDNQLCVNLPGNLSVVVVPMDPVLILKEYVPHLQVL